MSFTATPGPAALDHIAVACARLEDGVAWVAALLGVEPGPGGAHPDMGTHNRLLRLGADVYLEVIAPDPAVPKPRLRPRWFGFDDPAMQQRLREHGPRLVGFVARTSDIHTASASALVPPGPPTLVSRGALEWLFTVTPDGRLLEEGAVPPLIQWPDGMASPAARMPERGLRLQRLMITHPKPQHVRAAWASVGFVSDLVVVEPGDGVRLMAEIGLPGGGMARVSGF